MGLNMLRRLDIDIAIRMPLSRDRYARQPINANTFVKRVASIFQMPAFAPALV